MRTLADIDADLTAAYAQRRAIFESNESGSLDGVQYANRLDVLDQSIRSLERERDRANTSGGAGGGTGPLVGRHTADNY